MRIFTGCLLLSFLFKSFADVRQFSNPFEGGVLTQSYANTRSHPGIDYSSNSHEHISSAGFGYVTGLDDSNVEGNRVVITSTNPFECYVPGEEESGVQNWGGYNYLYSRHLIHTGRYVYTKYLHLEPNSISDLLNAGEFIASKQYIGDEGATGCVTAEHLHFEIGKTQTPQRYNQNGLNNTYNPDDFVTSHEYELALPLMNRGVQPTSASYDVFGYTEQKIYANLNLTGSFPDDAALVVRHFDKGADGSDNNLWSRSRLRERGTLGDSDRFLGGRQQNIPATGITANNSYRAGNYLFVAWVNDTSAADDDLYGYPVKFSFVNDTQVIVDNDQLPMAQQSGTTESKTDFTCSEACDVNKVPGYFLSAKVINAETRQSARWQPRRRGKFYINIHVPEQSEYSRQTYMVCPTGSFSCVRYHLTDPQLGWINHIRDDERIVNFAFDENGYVELNGMQQIRGSKGLVDAIKFSAHPSVWLQIKSRMGISGDLAQSIYRHFMEHGNSDLKAMDGDIEITVDYQHKTTTNGGDFSRYSIGDGTPVYINWVTGEIEDLEVCEEDYDIWFSAFGITLRKVSVPVCIK